MLPPHPFLTAPSPQKSAFDRVISFTHALDLSVDPHIPHNLGAYPIFSESIDPDPDLQISVSALPSEAHSISSHLPSGQNLLSPCLHNHLPASNQLLLRQSFLKQSGFVFDSFDSYYATQPIRKHSEQLFSPVTPKQSITSPVGAQLKRGHSDDVVTRRSTVVSMELQVVPELCKSKSGTFQSHIGHQTINVKHSNSSSSLCSGHRRSFRKSRLFPSTRVKTERSDKCDKATSQSPSQTPSNSSRKDGHRLSKRLRSRRQRTESPSTETKSTASVRLGLKSVLRRVTSRSPRLMSKLCKMFVRDLPIPANVATLKFRSVLERTYNGNIEQKEATLTCQLVLNLPSRPVVINMTVFIESRGPVSCAYIRRLQADGSRVICEEFEHFCCQLCEQVIEY